MMYKITAPVTGYNGISAGIRFADSVAVVNENCSLDRLNWFARRGYTVEEVRKSENEEVSRQTATDRIELNERIKQIDAMKTQELLDYGSELGLDLTACTKNDQRRELIIRYLTGADEREAGMVSHEMPALDALEGDDTLEADDACKDNSERFETE